MYIGQCHSPNSPHPPLPTQCPHIHSLCLSLYSCPVNRFIWTIFLKKFWSRIFSAYHQTCVLSFGFLVQLQVECTYCHHRAGRPIYSECSLLSCVPFFVTLWTVACQALLSMGILQARILSGLPCPSPGDLPDPEINPWYPVLAGRFFTVWAIGKLLLLLLSHFSCVRLCETL